MSVHPAVHRLGRSLGLLTVLLGLPAAASARPDSLITAGRHAQGYDGVERTRRSAIEGVRAALAESLTDAPAGPEGERARAYAGAVRALRAGTDLAPALESLRHGAEGLHDPRAAQLLGLLLTSGERVPRDHARAAHYYRMAAHDGGGCAIAVSSAQLAHAYFGGFGVERSDSLAARAVSAAYFGASNEACRAAFGDRDRWAAEQGLFYIAGETRLRGAGVRVDVPGALYQFDKGIRYGEAACALRAALLFLPEPYGDPVVRGRLAPDPGRALGYLERAHEAGVDEATLVLARCVADGIGAAPDPARADTLYERAADRGVPHARLERAARLSGGMGLVKDVARGRRELERAAREGDARAMGVLGTLLRDEAGAGGRVPDARRLAEAAGWFERGAAAGDAGAMHELALFHERGVHFPPDAAKAAEWHARARAAGYADTP